MMVRVIVIVYVLLGMSASPAIAALQPPLIPSINQIEQSTKSALTHGARQFGVKTEKGVMNTIRYYYELFWNQIISIPVIGPTINWATKPIQKEIIKREQIFHREFPRKVAQMRKSILQVFSTLNFSLLHNALDALQNK